MSRRLAFTAALGLLLAATTIGGGTVGSSGARPAGTVWLAERDGDRHGRAGTVWVVNRERGEVTIFDARTGRPRWPRSRQEPAPTRSPSRTTPTRPSSRTSSTTRSRSCPRAHSSARSRSRSARDRTTLEPSHDGDTILVGLVGTNAVAAIDADTDAVATFTSSSNPAARAHGPSLQDETIYVAHETGDEVTGIDAADGRHRVQHRRDPAAHRSAPRSTRATAVRRGTGRGEDQGHRPRRRHAIVGEVAVGDAARDDAAHPRPAHADRQHARHARPTRLRRHEKPHPHRAPSTSQEPGRSAISPRCPTTADSSTPRSTEGRRVSAASQSSTSSAEP